MSPRPFLSLIAFVLVLSACNGAVRKKFLGAIPTRRPLRRRESTSTIGISRSRKMPRTARLRVWPNDT